MTQRTNTEIIVASSIWRQRQLSFRQVSSIVKRNWIFLSWFMFRRQAHC
uniref:Uncharacterized protein n=1 Tax=Anguilla anguilla TaxID=7936 RepID=A0A0E9PND9_ANGAN